MNIKYAASQYWRLIQSISFILRSAAFNFCCKCSRVKNRKNRRLIDWFLYSILIPMIHSIHSLAREHSSNRISYVEWIIIKYFEVSWLTDATRRLATSTARRHIISYRSTYLPYFAEVDYPYCSTVQVLIRRLSVHSFLIRLPGPACSTKPSDWFHSSP